jgi:predicted RND superfamily exporter protein
VVGVIFLLSLVLARELRHLRLEVRLSDEVPAGHPYTKIDDRLAERLGAHQTAIVAVGVRDGDVVNPDTLARIRRLTDGIAKIPGVVPSSVLSLTAPHVKAVEADGDAVRVEGSCPSSPGDAASLEILRERILCTRCTSARSSRPTRAAR